MKDDVFLAINENELGNLAIEIINIADEISDIFSKVDNKFEELNEIFSGKANNSLYSSYRCFRKNYPIVKENIVSYSDDLICLINKVKQGDKKIALSIEQISELAQEETEKIKNK